MGAWGLAPFDNDQFADEFGDVTRKLAPEVGRQVNRQFEIANDGVSMWAAIGIFLWAFDSGLLDYKDAATRAVRALEVHDEFIHDLEYRDPAKFKKVDKAVRKRLEEIRAERAAPELPGALGVLYGAR